MHENRETSELSARGSGADRPEKAESRTAGMNGTEESDRGMVPMKQPNKGEPPVRGSNAEDAEGKARSEENISQTRTNPTQGGEKGVFQGLAGVRRAARERKGERFTALLHHLTLELLRDSFYALKRKAAAGVDGVRWEEYENGLEGRLADLHSRVHRGAYRAQPSRRVYIAKSDGRQRPLGIAALEDKIDQGAVVTILDEIYESDFLGISYGFRPERSQHQALDALTVGITRRRVNWVVDLDIRGFYDNMGHECGKNRKTGYFEVKRKTVKKRMRAKLQALKDELRRRLHEPLAETGKWLQTVVRGYYQYYAVPENLASLGLFRERLLGLWRHVIRRRSQKRPPNWDRLGRFFDRWLPRPCIRHPFPQVRFDARHPR